MTAIQTATDTSGVLGASPLLEVTDLVTHFRSPRGLVRSVDGVSLTLERGRTLGIVGESGSGKSVLSRSIMGLVPRSTSVRSGQVLFEGRDISGLSDEGYRELWGSEMAMVFQDPMTSLNPVMRVGKQITESLRFHLDMDKADANETAVQLLRAVRIPEPDRRMRAYPHEMSGGMRQRVVIAIALACGPKLLLADEPTTALDVTVQAQILDLLATQQRERFMAMILVTHDLGVVANRADEIAVMYAGRIVERAATSVLFREMSHPYTQALLSAIPQIGMPSHTRLVAIGGRPPDLVNPPDGCSFHPRCPRVQDRCRVEDPSLQESPTTPGHYFACHYPVDGPAPVSFLPSKNVPAPVGATPPPVVTPAPPPNPAAPPPNPAQPLPSVAERAATAQEPTPMITPPPPPPPFTDEGGR